MPAKAVRARGLAHRLADAEATIEALLSGQVDAVVGGNGSTPVLLSKAQDALRASEERYRRMIETANEGILTIDDRSVTTFANGRMARMLGYSVDEMIGLPLESLVAESERAASAQLVERGRQGHSEGRDSTLLRKDGSEIFVWVSAAPKLAADGRYIGGLAMITDRTQDRAAAEALRRSEEKYRQIVETTTDGIITVDPNGLITFVNRRLMDMVGYESHEMIGASALDFMSAEGRAVATAALARRAQGLKDSNDSVFLHRDGREVAVHITGSPVFDAQGLHTASLAVVRDVSEQRKLQSQLMVSDRMASMGTLAAGVAHEINNPLAAVMANLEYIADSLRLLSGSDRVPMDPTSRDAWIRDEIKPSLDDAREAAERVRFIVRDLKMFSRSPSDDVAVPVNVNATMESSLRMAWNEVRHRARLIKDYGRVPDVRANAARLGQVFVNLIINAAQAIPEGRAEDNEIRIATRLAAERVVIEVSDTGQGIPPDVRRRIFDAFFTTKAVGGGTGLGLAICHRIVTDLGGELTLETEMGVGTTFRVSLPVAEFTTPAIVAPSPLAPVHRRGRILVVDDDEMVVRVLTRILSRENDVVATLDAREALAWCARGEAYDLILCDLMMPIMTGMELHAELARVAPEQATRMIFVTGGAFTDRARRFLSETPKEHIEKPFDPVNLRAIVQRFLK